MVKIEPSAVFWNHAAVPGMGATVCRKGEAFPRMAAFSRGVATVPSARAVSRIRTRDVSRCEGGAWCDTKSQTESVASPKIASSPHPLLHTEWRRGGPEGGRGGALKHRTGFHRDWAWAVWMAPCACSY